jgi:hypothetical protein
MNVAWDRELYKIISTRKREKVRTVQSHAVFKSVYSSATLFTHIQSSAQGVGWLDFATQSGSLCIITQLMFE